MNRLPQTLITAAAILAGAAATSSAIDLPWPVSATSDLPREQLEIKFADPAAQPIACYYYMLNGNMSPAGIEADFRAMKTQGIDRAFIGYHGIDGLPHGQVWLQDSLWYECMRSAMRTAREVGIEVGVFNSPGWSQSGGPWVKPEDSQRYLAITDTVIEVGKSGPKKVILPKGNGYLGDFAVLAYPATEGRELRMDFKSDANSIEIEAPEGFTLRSATVKSPTEVIGDVAIEALINGKWEHVGQFGITRTNMMVEVGYDPLAPVTASFSPVTAGRFRITVNRNPEAHGGYIILSEDPAVASYADKSLVKLFPSPQPYWNEYKWPMQQSAPDTRYLMADDVHDLSSSLRGDTLSLSAIPAGRWKIARCYLAPTNILNGPALPGDGQGLEIDRWNPGALDRHFEAYVNDLEKKIPAEDLSPWKVIVADSYERGTQNIGDDFIDYFKQHFGYDPLPYLLSYKGIVVNSPEHTDRFLWDMRRCVADRLAYDYIGGLRRKARESGRTLWLEPYGHWGFPGEFLMYGGQSDEVAGEFWSFGTLGDYENRSASSVAHTYGKATTSAESFTVATTEFTLSPRDFKLRGDRFFAEGINKTLLHLYVSQPDDSTLPGVNAWFGNEFNRKNTWWKQFYQFNNYLKRANLLLQQGNYVADIAYYIGEDTPCMVGITEPAPPSGLQYDFINAEVICHALKGNGDHTMSLPHGTSYRLLVLPPSGNMRPETLRKIARIIRQGGVVLGSKPLRSPSLQGYPESDAEVKAMADSLWGPGPDSKRLRRIGKGMLFTGYSIEEVLAELGVNRDFDWNPADGTSPVSHAPVAFGFLDDGKADIRHAHYTSQRRDIYFVANQTTDPQEITATFRDARGRQPELWDAAQGTRRMLPQFSVGNDSAVTLPMKLAPQQSVFVVFERQLPSEPIAGENFPSGRDWVNLPAKWTLKLESPFGETLTLNDATAGSLSENDDPFVRHFSGTMTYTAEVKLPAAPKGKHVMLDLGSVGDMAEVRVNGILAGGVWTAPYTVDITNHIRKNVNKKEIQIVNNWNNRLIGDATLPEHERLTSLPVHTTSAASPLQPSGLLMQPRLIIVP